MVSLFADLDPDQATKHTLTPLEAQVQRTSVLRQGPYRARRRF